MLAAPTTSTRPRVLGRSQRPLLWWTVTALACAAVWGHVTSALALEGLDAPAPPPLRDGRGRVLLHAARVKLPGGGTAPAPWYNGDSAAEAARAFCVAAIDTGRLAPYDAPSCEAAVATHMIQEVDEMASKVGGARGCALRSWGVGSVCHSVCPSPACVWRLHCSVRF